MVKELVWESASVKALVSELASVKDQESASVWESALVKDLESV